MEQQAPVDWRKKNTSMFLRYLSRALESNIKVPVLNDENDQQMRVITPSIPMTKMTRLRPYMFPPELTDKKEARKSFKKYGHWKKVDFKWVDISKIGVPDDYVAAEECDDICKYWKRFLDDDIPIPAIRVYSDMDLELISDGVQRVKVLKDAGFKYVLVYYRYETNDDPP